MYCYKVPISQDRQIEVWVATLKLQEKVYISPFNFNVSNLSMQHCKAEKNQQEELKLPQKKPV